MARASNGVYTLPVSNPVVTGTLISSVWANNTLSDLATEMTDSLDRSGKGAMLADLQFGGFKGTGVAPATARTDVTSLANIQDAAGVYIGTVGGTVDAITLTPVPALPAYSAGQRFQFIAAGANTTAVTINISGLGAKALTKQGTIALTAGDIISGSLVQIRYDGTRFQITDALILDSSKRTAAEIAAAVTPTSYGYAPTDIRRYGADSTGVADVSAALAAADLVAVNGGGSTVFYPGTYKLSVNTTTAKPLVFLAGAVISIDAAKTLTANGQVISLSANPNAGLGTIVYGYEVNLFTNAFGFGIGKEPSSNTDDFIHIRRDVDTATGINIENQSAGASCETYLHLFSDVANAGASIRCSVNSIAGGALADIVASQNLAFSIIQASAAPLNFYVNNALMFSMASVVAPVNYWQFKGGAVASSINVSAQGADANISATYDVKGTGSHFFRTAGGTINQVEISNTAGATRRIVLTGSNGGNPKVDVSAGNLQLGGTATEIQWQKALVALGGGAAPTFGTIGGAGPATAAQNTWMRVADTTGAIFWVPAWK